MRYQTWLGSWWVRVPADLAAAVGYALLVAAVFYLPVTDTVVRTLVGAPLLFFLPGYVTVAAAFPGRQPASTEASGALARATSTVATRGFTWVERAALSFGASVALLPLLALAESLALGSFSAPATVATLAGFVTVGAVVAGVRRLRLPADERYRGPVAAWAADLHAAIFDADSTVDALVTAALAVAVLLAVSTMAYAMAAPQEGEGFSTLGVYTENESGDLVADGYPTELAVGEPADLVAAVENHERRDVDYTLVVELQRVRTDGDSATVVEDAVLDRETRTVAAGETWTWRHQVAPTFAGEQLRVTYYLYRGDAPDDPSAETAYRRAFVWVNVTAG